MAMGLLTWLIVGALAGWIASLIMGKDAKMGIWANLLVGILGAAVGGWLASLFGLGTVNGFNLMSLLIAIGGACLLLFVVGLIARR